MNVTNKFEKTLAYIFTLICLLPFKEIGVLWRKQGKKGSYLTGTLDIGVLGKVNIAVFETEKREGDDKKPDARIMLFEDD